MINKCVLCVLTPVVVSGIFGYLAGHVAKDYGLSYSSASTLAGFVGFMSAQTFNFVCLLITTRYARKTRNRRKACIKDNIQD
jgi:uncharacterized membrane protein YgaE (UPF0421/DUF939 family)